MRTLQEFILKGDGIFMLNKAGLSETTLTVLLKLDRDLNYAGGFGSISSSDATCRWIFIAKYDAGKFHHPWRFFCHENDGPFICDDSSATFD